MRSRFLPLHGSMAPLLRTASLAMALAIPAAAQNLLPNPSFDDGGQQPDDWQLSGSAGAWSVAGRTGHAVEVEGSGKDSGFWRANPRSIQAGALYSLRFWARRDARASGGTAIAGLSRVNRDFRLGDQWQEYGFVARVPDDGANDFMRFGQWEMQGSVFFDDARFAPVVALHRRFPPGFELGEAESVRDGIYRFSPTFGWVGANVHRTLATNRAGFNTDRWLFGTGSEVVYRLGLADVPQAGGRLQVHLNYYVAGELHIEASRDGLTWSPLATLNRDRQGGSFNLPGALFPATQVLVRLFAPLPGTQLQLNALDYEARLTGKAPDAEGRTHFLTVGTNSLLTVAVEGLQQGPGGAWEVALRLTSQISGPSRITGWASSAGTPRPASVSRTLLPLAPTPISLPLPTQAPGRHTFDLALRADEGGSPLWQAQLDFQLGWLEDPRPGYALATNRDVNLWWCESGWNIGRTRPPPTDTPSRDADPVTVSLAQGEFEAVQVILHPVRSGALEAATFRAFRGPQDSAGSIKATVHEVAYVQVTTPTDPSGEAGWHPDPLPPLSVPLKLEAGVNQPLWLTFHAPRGARSGAYLGELQLTINGTTLPVPLRVRVRDFELPRDTHLRSAFGLGTGTINRYHRLTNRADRVAVFGEYLQNFAEHRISPYSFFDYDPIEVRFAGEGDQKRAMMDFARFDAAAARWLDGARFNSFLLPLRGMGGGTFHSRSLGELEGFKEGTPEHARLFQDYLGQIVAHLREKGWLDRAYTYWFDEPDPKDYAFVVEGMKRIRAAAPGLRRMLTEQPEPELQGHVEIWCGLTPEWSREKVQARHDAGEEVWWYICTGPKAPYVTEFIDHPGTELRLWPWQSWQYGVDGILVWATTYWTSPLAYPEPTLQDPYRDPMSWVSGYGNPVGSRLPWGNGDGRFLYPPRRDPNAASEPCLDAPINSVRWESLRDGMEDYEYFWLLQQEIRHIEASKSDAGMTQDARRLLNVPTEISTDLTHFTTDPRRMLEHRERVARMIERLRNVR